MRKTNHGIPQIHLGRRAVTCSWKWPIFPELSKRKLWKNFFLELVWLNCLSSCFKNNFYKPFIMANISHQVKKSHKCHRPILSPGLLMFLRILVINFMLFCTVQEGPDCVILFQIEANEFNCQDQIKSLILNINDS